MQSSDFAAIIVQIARQMPQTPLPTEGVIVPGSYDPQTGTVEVAEGISSTLLNSPEFTEAPIQERVPLLTNHVGDQGGPIGGERCLIIPMHGGKVALLYHGPDDSPNVPAGEKHTYLRSNDVNQAKASFVKVQVDATRVGHAQKVTVLAPAVVLGTDQSADDLAIVRKKDLAQFKRDIIQAVQQALNQGFQTVQPGNGVPPPTVQDVQVQASQTGFSA